MAAKYIVKRARYTSSHGLHHLRNGHLSYYRAVARNDKTIFRGMRKRKSGRRHSGIEADLVPDREKLTRTSVLPSPEPRGFCDSIGSGRFRPDHAAVVEIPSRHTKQIAISGHVGDNQIVSRHGAQSPFQLSVIAQGFSSITEAPAGHRLGAKSRFVPSIYSAIASTQPSGRATAGMPQHREEQTRHPLLFLPFGQRPPSARIQLADQTKDVIMSKAHLPPRYLRTPEAARFLGMSGRTLEKHRYFGTGPAYLRLSCRIVYG